MRVPVRDSLSLDQKDGLMTLNQEAVDRSEQRSR